MTFTRLFITVLAASVLLSSCGSSNKFASSFGKRKYTKGYYVDVAGAVPAVASKEVKHTVSKQIVSAPAKKVTVPAQQSVVVCIKPVEKHASLTVAKSSNKVVKMLTAVLPAPIVDAVSNIGTYGGRHDGNESNGNTSIHVILSLLLFLAPPFIAIAGLFGSWFDNATDSSLEALIALWMAMLVASIICGIIAIEKREPGYGFSVPIILLDLLLLLLGFELLLGGV